MRSRVHFITSLCLGVLLLLIAVPLLVGLLSSTTSANADAAESVAPGSSLSLEIAAGNREKFVLNIDRDQLLRFSVEKGDLLLKISLYGPSNIKLLEHASQDFEVIEISFPADVSGTYRIEIESREQEKSRRYKLSIRSFTPVTITSHKDSEAQQAFSRAEVLRTNWTEAALREATENFDKAATIWTATRNFSRASNAKLKAGDLCFSLSQYKQAGNRYQTAATLGAKAGDHLAEGRALSELGLLRSYLGDNESARDYLNKALTLLGGCEVTSNAVTKNACAIVLSNSAEVVYAKGDLLNSSRQFERVAKLFDDDRKGRAKVHLFAGNIAGTLGEPDKAKEEISRAHSLYREINNRAGEGLALIGLGLTHSLDGDQSGALKLYREAGEVFESIGDRHSQAISLNSLGQAYENLKAAPIALTNYKNALQLFQDVGARDLAAVTMAKVARVHYLLGEYTEARSLYERALKEIRAAGKARSEVNALSELAEVYDAQGQPQQALQLLEKVQSFYESIGDRQGQALFLNREGDVLLRVGQTEKALKIYGKALVLSEQLGDKEIIIDTVFNLARASQKAGKLEPALSFIRRSLNDIETLRSNVGNLDLRTSYFSGVQQHYELCIEILMQLSKLHPGAGFDEEAFEISEKSRARSLVDLLTESRAGIREGATADLLAQERKLRGLLRARIQYTWTLQLSNADASEIDEVAAEVSKLNVEYETVQSQLREQNPHLTSLARFTPLNLKQIQRELHDGKTLLLQYALGKERSYLWAVTSNSFASYELPPGETIESAAREVYKLITARQRSEGNANRDYQTEVITSDDLLREKSKNLSQMLFEPVAEQLGNKILLLVPDGALRYVPFDALPVPLAKNASPPPESVALTLLDTNEIVEAASMSTLVAIRNARTTSPSSRKVVAVLADPVFSRNDDRVQHVDGYSAKVQDQMNQSSQELITRSLDEDLRGGFARLVHASQEADAISAAAPYGTSFVAKGFDASRETAMSPAIGEYQILHFATHGVLDSKHPERSGIVLTMVDRNGGEKNGLMPLYDIYSLQLSSEVTVLSACQTALGKDVKGEGFVGLTHSFISAGSKSVIASLWKVDDRATAALMTELYQSMLKKGMTPAAALRAAKLEIKRRQQWSAPYYWAGFVLQGDYTNRISVESRSWIRVGIVLLSFLVLVSLVLIAFRKRLRWSISRLK